MKTIAYVSPMVPAEWIAAHGLRPHWLRLRATGGEPLPAVTRGVCPYAGLLRATVISGLDAAALVLTTTCDQMRYTAALLEQYDSCVALDGTQGGERTEPRLFDPARVALDPLAELADAYFSGIPDPFRRPNSPFYEWLGRKLAARRVRGIIFRRYLWCDLWHAELQRLRQRSALPVLEIDVGPDDTAAPGRVQGRIEAFLETLQ